MSSFFSAGRTKPLGAPELLDGEDLPTVELVGTLLICLLPPTLDAGTISLIGEVLLGLSTLSAADEKSLDSL